MAKLEEMEAQIQEEKRPFLLMRAQFILKWGGRGNEQMRQELDALLREYLRMMAT